jgi:diguanylate cyclase (GGDEF)-like protein/PAS domain S-box-containing protein
VASTVRLKSIGVAMALPTLLVLAPVAFLLHFLIGTHNRGIATARNEIAGVPVLAAAGQLRHAIVEEALGGESGFNRAEALAARGVLAKSHLLWPQDATLAVQLSKAIAAADRFVTRGPGVPEDVADAISAISGVYAVTANVSELILDPELDTYYLMDLKVNRFPALMRTLWALQGARTPDADETDAVRSARMRGYRALLKDQSDAAIAAYAFARQHQRDSGVAAALDKGFKRFEVALQARGLEVEGISEPDPTDVLELLFASRGAEQAVADELVRLLQKRIDAFENERNQQVVASVSFLLIVIVALLILMRRLVVRPVRKVTSTMRKLAGGDLDIEVNAGGRRDEIGDMIKAINVFRETAVTRIRLEAEAARAARLIEESASALERAEKAAHLGNWRYDIAEERLTWSKAMFPLLGFDAAEGAPGLTAIAGRIHQGDLLRLVASMESLKADIATSTFDVRIGHPETGLRHLRLWIEVEFNDRRIPRALFGTAQDVTELKEGQLALEARTRALAEAQAIGRIGNWGWRLGSSVIEWSPEIFDILGFDPDHFIPDIEKVRALYLADALPIVREAQRKVMEHKGTEGVDVQARRGDGSIADVTVITKGELDEKGELIGFVGTIQDISDRKRAERDLEKLAFFDPLTGLANRALFHRSIARMIASAEESARKAALFLIDLDKFKEVNDSLGHAAGDDLLMLVAGILKRGMPDDVFLARLGGDEFAVIIPDADQAAAEAIGAHLIELLGATLELKQGEVNIGASIGFVIVPEDGREPEELLRKADLALYKAKDDGRNRLQRFLPELSEIVQEKNRIARDLRRAIENGKELEVHYQPQFDTRTGRITGYEALLRWKHPERGYIPPAYFVPIAESAALIYELGLWIMREACRQMQAWIEAGQPARDIAVNVSAAQLWQGEFEADVRRILAETRLSPKLLTLEVTESLFVREGEGRVSRILSNLNGLGVTLALDDFGTGYSSLGYLNQLPFQRLKIDRVFVAGVDASPQRERLLRGILELGRGLGMTIIAEGAERAEEVAVLHKAGCDKIQGFVFSKPLPAGQVIPSSAMIEARWRQLSAA